MNNSRIIKFRVWDTLNRKMVYEPYRFVPAPAHWKDYPDEKFHVGYEYFVDYEDEINGIDRPCEVMQFTGLLDKNNLGIWEGDIVKFTPNALFAKYYDLFTGIIFYKNDEAAFFHTFEEGRPSKRFFNLPDEWELEVIGNIYETPN